MIMIMITIMSTSVSTVSTSMPPSPCRRASPSSVTTSTGRYPAGDADPSPDASNPAGPTGKSAAPGAEETAAWTCRTKRRRDSIPVLN
jgi:hypothetical protein